MLTAQIAIIGGGLSGLYAASLLEERGITDYVLFEARDTFGGRIVSVPGMPVALPNPAEQHRTPERYDLGATWFWPDLQPDLQRLVDDLRIPTFEQHEAGDILIERSPAQSPARVDGYATSPSARRLAGGMSTLIDAVRHRLPADKLTVSHRVTCVAQLEACIEVTAEDATGRLSTHRVASVLLAVPPRLAASTIDFVPALPEAVTRQWTSCPTWMAPHAKYVAVFDQPFWRTHGLSGGARSAVGPLVEIHDASPEAEGAALFGFIGVPAGIRRTVPESTLIALCRAQLVRLFGDQAGSPRAEFLKDWSTDPHTATAADQQADGHHAMGLARTPGSGAWTNRLIGIASEWSPAFSGYVAGAIDAARRGVEAVASQHASACEKVQS